MKGQKAQNRKQVKARVARKNRKVETGLNLRPVRIKSLVKGQKAPNRTTSEGQGGQEESQSGTELASGQDKESGEGTEGTEQKSK